MATTKDPQQTSPEAPSHGPPVAASTRAASTRAASTSSAGQRTTPGSWVKRGIAALFAVAALGLTAFLLSGAASPEVSGPKLTHTVRRGELRVTVTEDGTLESSSNTEIKCKVKGGSTVLSVIDSGTEVQPGDVLVRLDTSTIEDNINQQKITYQNALATFAQSESDVAVAEISITEYLEGTFRTELQTAQSNVAISEENLRVAQNILDHAERLFRKGYVSKLELDGNRYSVEHARLQLDLMKTQVDALQKFTKPKMLQELRSAHKAAVAKLESDKAALDLEKARLDRQEQQLENCIIRAERSGMVIYPSAAEWKEQPDIEEGATVREDQVLLIIPDLTDMQVKVGIHEAKVDRVKPGLTAEIELQDDTVTGTVFSVASVTRPAGWWTGNAVKYDTIIKLDSSDGLKPGMSAAVEILIEHHQDVLTVPVASVVQGREGYHCWVRLENDVVERRNIDVGDNDEEFIIVESGIKEGDTVVLNPIAYIDEAQAEALRPSGNPADEASDETGEHAGEGTNKPANVSPGKTKQLSPDSGQKKTGKTAVDPSEFSGDAIVKQADTNADGVLTMDEFAEKDRDSFSDIDEDGNGEITAAEMDAMLQKKMSESAGTKD